MLAPCLKTSWGHDSTGPTGSYAYGSHNAITLQGVDESETQYDMLRQPKSADDRPTFDASAAVIERADVALDAGGPAQLVLHEVGVVGTGDEVVRQRVRHLLAHLTVRPAEDITLGREQVPREACRARRIRLQGGAFRRRSHRELGADTDGLQGRDFRRRSHRELSATMTFDC